LDFTEDKNGLLYLSALSDSSFLYRFDEINNRFEQLSKKIDFHNQELGDFAIHQIDTDVYGTLWMATNYGIFTFSNQTLKKLPGMDYFPTHLIRSISVSELGDVWIGAENGLFSYKDGSLLEYEISDGLPSMTINYRSSLIDKRGRLWVGTNNGLAYQFTSTDDNRQTPAPFIKTVHVGTDVVYTRPNFIESFDSRKSIRIEYHSYIFPQNKIRYQYNINKSGWSDFTQQTSLSLANLEPDTYSIQFRAVKRGHSTSNSNTIQFTVTPVWYFTWYLQVLYVAIFALLGLLFIRYRITVSEQIRTSRLLNQTEQRLQLLLNNAPVLLFSLDKYLNFHIFAGKAADEFIEDNGVKPRHVNHLFSGFSELPELQEVMNGKVQVVTLQVHDKVFDTRLTPILNRQGQLAEIIGISLDITNRILAEKELLEAKNIAEKANIAKSVFLANMSHELRTPLNAILGFASLLVKQQTSEEQQKKYLNTIYSSGEHLLLMINEILDLSKIESGKMEILLESIDITSMMLELEIMFQVQAVRKNLVFESLIDTNVPQYILTDSKKLRQILINLIGNAIKYTDKGLVSVWVHCDKISKKLLIDVKDTGAGIPDEMQGKIFQPFKQVQSNYSDGTGLGLSIAKGIADLLGGEISVKSEYGKGSTFTLEIPLTEISNKEVEPVLDNSFDEVRNFKIASGSIALVVDDKLENRELMSDYLKHFGFETVLVSNGKEAVEAVQKQDFTIILMDIYMPVMDGKQAFSHIRKMKPMIPIVAVTAGGFEEFKSDLEVMGFNGFLHKPFKDIQLVNILKRLVPVSVNTLKISNDQPTRPTDDIIQLQELKQQINQLPKQNKDEFIEAIDLMDFETIIQLCSEFVDSLETRIMLIDKAKSNDYKFFLHLSELFQNE
jgi:signal transduction histidine kinase/CheY-like chemotaxis protein